MATSERVVNTLAGSAGMRPMAAGRFRHAGWPLWWQATLDFLTLWLGIIVVPSALATLVGADVQPSSFLSAISIAIMVTTVLAFAGSYPARPTPIRIGATEGLVRGACCVLLLMVFGSIATRIRPPVLDLMTAAILLGLLSLQRELAYVLGGKLARGATSADVNGLIDDYVCRCGMPVNPKPAGHLLKRALDVAIALPVLLLAMPLFVVVAVLIKCDSRGPALIRQRRIGKSGVPFFMWKFRSMHAGVCRYERSPVTDCDPRLTRFGRALRRLSIDELPQLLNVLCGEMSLVGPRPEMPFIVQNYQPRERLRLEATPGITGLWQISPARAMPIHQNLELDLFYIANRNIFLDLAILLRTLTAVVRGIGAM